MNQLKNYQVEYVGKENHSFSFSTNAKSSEEALNNFEAWLQENTENAKIAYGDDPYAVFEAVLTRDLLINEKTREHHNGALDD